MLVFLTKPPPVTLCNSLLKAFAYGSELLYTNEAVTTASPFKRMRLRR